MNREYNDNREYNSAMDELRFSKEAKENMINRLMETEENKTTRRTRRSFMRPVTIGVAAALVLTIGASATGVLKSAGEAFAGVFGGVADTEIIDKIGRPIGASDTDNGVTITADAIVGDKYHYAITYSIEKEDGTPFDIDLSDNIEGRLPLGFQKWDENVGHMGGSHGSAYFYDANPDDNAIQYVSMMETDSEIPRGTAKVSLENLRYMGKEGKAQTLIEGKWNLKFQMDYEDTSVSLPAGQSFVLNGMDATIDAVTLSPIAIRVDYTVDSEVQWDKDAESGKRSEHDRAQDEKYFESMQIALNKKDGTKIELSGLGGSIEPKNGKTVCQKGSVLEEIIPLEEIASVTVQGIEIPLE